jgi:hypothetical protein
MKHTLLKAFLFILCLTPLIAIVIPTLCILQALNEEAKWQKTIKP